MDIGLTADMTKHEAAPARDRLWARYRDKDFADRLSSVPWNEALDIIMSHRSVRSYRDEPLPPGTLELLIAAASSAATTSNLQAWSVVAVEDPARKPRLASFAASQRHIVHAPLLLIFVADLARRRSISTERGHAGIALNYVEAFIFAIADASFAAQNAIVAAESIGLGGCYIGAMRNHPAAVADELALPDETLVVFGMTIGIPDPSVQTDVKPRLPQNVILHRERYSPPDSALLAAYDQRIRDFQAEQKMRVTDWTEQSALRVRDEAALTGREVLRDFLRDRGFSLR